MATVGKELADDIIRRNGYYEGDPRVMRVVEYTDFGGRKAYGIEYPYEVGKYTSEPDNPYIGNPKVIWEAK